MVKIAASSHTSMIAVRKAEMDEREMEDKLIIAIQLNQL